MIPTPGVLQVQSISRGCNCCDNAHWVVAFKLVEGHLNKGSYHFYPEECGYYADPRYEYLVKLNPDYTAEPHWYIHHDKLMDGDFNLWVRINEDIALHQTKVITFDYRESAIPKLEIGEHVLTYKVLEK